MFSTCFGVLFSKIFFAQCSMEGRVFEMFLNKIKKKSKFQKRPKSFPNCPNVFWTCFGVLFSEISFCVVFHGGSSLRNGFKKSEILQNSKNAQNRSQKCPNVFSTCFGVNFSRNFFVQCSKEGRVFEMFLKNFQNSKNAQNRSQFVQTCFVTCFGLRKVIFSRNFFREIFFAQCSKEGRVFEMFLKNFQNSKNAQKRSQFVQTCFERVLG